LTEDELRRIAGNVRSPWGRRAAAVILVRAVEYADLADFVPLLDGLMTLEQLRASGVNTDAVKRLRYGKRAVTIELHDRARAAIELIMDRTEGKARKVQ
jgi:hypothetical protein